MIVSFKNKSLRELFQTGKSKGVAAALQKRCRVRLDAMQEAEALRNLDLPSFRLHPLLGHTPTRHAIAVNGPWRITFRWTDDGPADVDLEQYH